MASRKLKVGNSGRFRKKNEPIQSVTMMNFVTKGKVNENADIVKCLLDDVIQNAVEKSCRKKKKHAGEKLSEKTLQLWQTKYHWLVLDRSQADLRMKCSVCTERKLNSAWANDGSTNIQKNALERHCNSKEHVDAEAFIVSKRSEPTTLKSEQNESRMNVSDDDRALFRTVYYAAAEELPSSKINSLLELQCTNGCKISYKNLSWDTISEIQRCMCEVFKQEIVAEIEKSVFYSIMIDESTDITMKKHLSVCVRYVKDGESVTKFLGNVALEDGKAHTIVRCLIEFLESLKLDTSRLVSLATDGASVMMGSKTGVGVQIKAKYAPFAVQTHCIAHRLNLAVTDSIKKDKALEKFRNMFSSLYLFMSGSSVRTEKLKKIQQLLEEPELTVKEPHSIRWLGLKNAVDAVFSCYNSVLATLSSFAAEGNPTASGLLKYFANYRTVLMVAFMLDIHEELADLSVNLQKQSIVFSEIEPLLQGTTGKLEYLKLNDGPCMREMKGCIDIKEDEDGHKCASLNGEKLLTYKDGVESDLQKLRQNYVECLQKNMKQRFRKNDSEIFKDLSLLLDPMIVNSADPGECENAVEMIGINYGESKEVKVVHGDMAAGYQEDKRDIGKLLDKDKLKDEWPKLKGMLTGCYKNLSTKAMCKRVIQVHADKGLSEFTKLCTIALCISVTSVECERSFSTQNRLKNKYRSSLKENNLDHLITMNMSMVPFVHYDPSKAVEIWLKKKRRKRRLFEGYKPRASKKAKKC